MIFELICGIDPAKMKFDYHLVDSVGQTLEVGIVENTKEAITLFLQELLSVHQLPKSKVLFCVENTGSYNNRLMYGLYETGISTWLVDSFHLNRSIGRVRGKTDQLDAARIAKFACRNYQDAEFFKPKSEVALKLRSLESQRSRMLKSLHIVATSIKEEREQSSIDTTDWFIHSEELATSMRQAIKALECEMNKVIMSDDHFKQVYKIACSVPGIGPVTARLLICTTDGFTKFSTARQLASFAGIAPLPYESGSSIKRKLRSSTMTSKNIKSKLTMGAISLIGTERKMAAYYANLIAKGKEHLVAINAVRNKMIRTVVACVKNNRMYDENYSIDLDIP